MQWEHLSITCLDLARVRCLDRGLRAGRVEGAAEGRECGGRREK